MTFPVQFNLFGHIVPAHAIMELAAYCVGVQTYLLLRRRRPDPSIKAENLFWLIVFCVFGALVGSKLLAWMDLSPDETAAQSAWPQLIGGKTIVGGLIGGWLGVEFGKKWFGINYRTGDAYVLPLVLGIAIGRIGCFLEGLPDHTYGIATSLPWGVDFGDGIARHPTQLYEIAFALLWGIVVWVRSRKPYHQGDLFRLFMLGYFGFRLMVEFIKPVYRPSGLSAIQWACVLGIGMSAYGLLTHQQSRTMEVNHVTE